MHSVDISANPVGASIDLDLTPPPIENAVMPTKATATSMARVPVVTGQRFALVTAIPATSQAQAQAPLVGGTNASFAVAVRANSTALARVPVVSGSATVTAVVATSTAVANGLVNPINASATAVKAGSTSAAPIPSVSGETVLTGGGPGTASALARPPTVTTGAATFVSPDAGAGTAALAPAGGNIQWSHTATGSNRAVLVAVALSEVAPNGDWNNWTAAATYGGNAMTPIVVQGSANSNAGFVFLFKLMSPPTGAQTVSVTFTNAAAGTPDVLIGHSQSYTGCLSIDSLAGGAGNFDPADIEVNSLANSVAYAAICGGSNLSAPNQNQRYLNNFSSTAEAGHLLVQDAAGAATVSFTVTVGDSWGGVGCSLNPF